MNLYIYMQVYVFIFSISVVESILFSSMLFHKYNEIKYLPHLFQVLGLLLILRLYIGIVRCNRNDRVRNYHMCEGCHKCIFCQKNVSV